MSRRSRSSLFLMEQLIVILIFAICAAACVKIFVDSYLTTMQAHDLSYALLEAENGAECYKAVNGDIAQLAEVLGGVADATTGSATAYVYYNHDWQVCTEADAAYILCLSGQGAPNDAAAPLYGELTVLKTTGEELIALTVAARRQQDE